MGMKKGSIKVEAGAQVSVYEYAAARYFKSLGYAITFLAPLRIANQRTADMRIDGSIWELKTPIGNSSRTLQGALRRSKGQSDNIILDCRFTKRTDAQLLKEARASFNHIRSIKRMWLVLKDSTLVEFTK